MMDYLLLDRSTYFPWDCEVKPYLYFSIVPIDFTRIFYSCHDYNFYSLDSIVIRYIHQTHVRIRICTNGKVFPCNRKIIFGKHRHVLLDQSRLDHVIK